MILKVLGVLFAIAGAIIIFGARGIVTKFNLDKDVKCGFQHNMEEEDINRFKNDKAVVNMKMWGLIVALPGFIMILIAFK